MVQSQPTTDPGSRSTLESLLTPWAEAVAAAYLYGSRARGSAGRKSDVDLAILPRDPEPRRLGDLAQTIEAELEAALEVPVEVVRVDLAPPDLVHRVLRDRKLVLEADRSARIRFEVAARNRCWDLVPILQRYRESSR